MESRSDVSNMAAPRAKQQLGRTWRNSRKNNLISLEEEMEERLRVSLESRFSSFQEKNAFCAFSTEFGFLEAKNS